MRYEIDLYDENLEQAILDLPFDSKISDNENMVFLPKSDYGFGEIYRMYDDILVFLIPEYGGTPTFYKCFGRHAVKYLIQELKSLS